MIVQAKNVDRFAIIRLQDGRFATWERQTMTAITADMVSVKLKGDTPVQIVKFPAQLAYDWLLESTLHETPPLLWQ